MRAIEKLDRLRSTIAVNVLILCTDTFLQGNVCKIKQGRFLNNKDKTEESTVFCGMTSCVRNTPTFLRSVFLLF